MQVRRFFCDAAPWGRTTFAEQVAGFTRPYAQRAEAFNASWQALGLALGGAAGSRLGRILGLLGSGDTILRRVRSAAAEPPAKTRVVGIDEWAIRKGQRYGSLIVDLERREPIGLLPEHSAEQSAAWLQVHPGIEGIARDRATLYAEALEQGAPEAHQVADRWHLLQNLRAVLQEMLTHHTAALRDVARELTEQRRQEPPLAEPRSAPELPVSGHVVGPLELRQHQFAEAKRLRAEGWSVRRIAAERQLDRRTVTTSIPAEQLSRRVLPQNTSTLAPFMDYLRERWTAAERHGPRLLADLHERGYGGSLSSLYRALKAFRSGDGRRQPPALLAPRMAVRSPRQAMWLLTRSVEDLFEEDLLYRKTLCARVPLIATAAELAQRFIQMIRTRQHDALDKWWEDAGASTIKELVNFARSLRRDYSAVRAALTTDWSNGPTEGHINRLKMIKRTMYGRAGFDLFRQRVLLAA